MKVKKFLKRLFLTSLSLVIMFAAYSVAKRDITNKKIENEIVKERQMSVLEQLEERQPPTLIVNGSTFRTGTVIKLTDLIEKATTLAENGIDEVNIKDKVNIICNSKFYIEESKSLLPTNAGVYEARFSVQDDYGLSTTVLVKIVVVDKVYF